MSEENELPEGWVSTKLGEIRIDRSKGIEPNKVPEQLFELYSVPSFDLQTPEIVYGSDIGSNKQTVETDTVLLCKINPRINRAWVVGDHSNYPKIASTEWIPFFRLQEVVPAYLCYYLSLVSVRDYLAANASGVGGSLMRITSRTIAEYPIPLPPLLEQHRIVAAIEQQFTRLDVAVAALRRARTKLKRYRAAVLKAAVEGRLTEAWRAEHPTTEPASVLLERILKERRAKWEADLRAKGKDPGKVKYVEPAVPDMEGLSKLPEGWCWATVEQVGKINEQVVLTGPFGSNLGREDFIVSGVPVLTIGCLTEQGVSLEKAFYISDEKASELERYRVRAGDLLFSRMASVGRADLVSIQLEGSIINYHLMRLRLEDAAINSNYFIMYVRGSHTVVDYIKEVNHGVTRDGINTNQLLILPVALPPLAEQEQIVTEVERHLSLISQLETAVEANLKRAERLRQSILREAFAGRLVPQDSDDEPASVLLERIRDERGSGERKNGTGASKSNKGRAVKVPEPGMVDVAGTGQVELWEGVGG